MDSVEATMRRNGHVPISELKVGDLVEITGIVGVQLYEELANTNVGLTYRRINAFNYVSRALLIVGIKPFKWEESGTGELRAKCHISLLDSRTLKRFFMIEILEESEFDMPLQTIRYWRRK